MVYSEAHESLIACIGMGARVERRRGKSAVVDVVVGIGAAGACVGVGTLLCRWSSSDGESLGTTGSSSATWLTKAFPPSLGNGGRVLFPIPSSKMTSWEQ